MRRRDATRTTLQALAAVAAVGLLAGAALAVCGDADGDGEITIVDGVQALRAAAELSSVCNADCDVDGSAFCDGNYVDSGNNLDQCLDYLGSLGIEVEASGSAECEGNTCEAEGTASCKCDLPGASTSSSYAPGIMAALAALGAVFARRRRDAK